MEYLNRLLKLDKRLEVWKFNNGYIGVSYASCDISDGIFLISCSGSGENFYDACKDYCEKISGKKLVFDAMTDYRTEVTVLF